MRILLLVVCCLGFSALVSAGNRVSVEDLIVKEGVRYLPSENQPYTGFAVNYYDNGHKKLQVMFREGMKHGKETAWYEGGELKSVVRYKSGKPQSYGSYWHGNPTIKKAEPTKFLSCDELNQSSYAYTELCGSMRKVKATYMEFTR